MKKMTSYIIAGIVTAIIVFVCAMAVKETEIDSLKEAYKTEISIKDCSLRRQEAEISSLRSSLIEAVETNKRKTAEIEKLNDVIIRMRTIPAADQKERIPDGRTNVFFYEYYTKITDPTTDAYKLQQECFTGFSTGIRLYEDDEGDTYYCAALGSAYGTDIGDAWAVTLKNGVEFKIIRADFKNDPLLDPNYYGDSCQNYDGKACTNVIEFVVEEKAIPSEVREKGTYSALNAFGGLYGDGGDIAKIEYLGRKWQP